MGKPAHPYRSMLYIPASNGRALEKARALPTDAIIFDLEDAVAAGEKASARARLVGTLAGADYGARALIVRINGFETPWGEADLEAIAATRPAAILLPKVSGAADIAALAARLEARAETAQTRIWAMMESARGILDAATIARAPRMAGFVLGTNDLAKELGCRVRADRLALMTSLQLCVLAARATGLVCIDGVYNAFRDIDGLRRECEQGRDLGFDGKTLIHPAQVAVANEIFAPSAAEVALALRQIAAFEEAEAAGQGVAVVDGRIVEALHVESARATLAKARAIARRASSSSK